MVNLSTIYAFIPYVTYSYYISPLAGTKMSLRSWTVICPGGIFVGTISSLYYKASAEATHASSHSSKAYLKNKKNKVKISQPKTLFQSTQILKLFLWLLIIHSYIKQLYGAPYSNNLLYQGSTESAIIRMPHFFLRKQREKWFEPYPVALEVSLN